MTVVIAVVDSSDLTAGMRLLDDAKHRGFTFRRMSSGRDAARWSLDVVHR
ncbi:MAG TPA: hypothetical protein VHH34_11565 [Pseudonocardiaceae bacterium]|nr:hypothetical protein [Pseudonocardiaceae bacterium]